MNKKILTLLSNEDQENYIRDNRLMELACFSSHPDILKVARDCHGNIFVRGKVIGSTKIMWHCLDIKFEKHKGFADQDVTTIEYINMN
jgi:hypothetical protein